SDEAMIPALQRCGVPREEAVGYGIVGCVGACVPGRMQGVTAGGHINMAKALELALNAGRSTVTGKQVGEATPDPARFESFDDLWDAYRRQVQYLAGLNMLAAVVAGEAQKRGGHCPLASALLDDCLTARRDLVAGGTRYNLPGIAIYGPTNAYDGLAAARKHVCETGRVSWAELRDALASNWQDAEDLRQLFAEQTPRFGNGAGEADAWAQRINALHAEFCYQHVDSRGGRFTCGVWPVEAHVGWGKWTGATPDGRRAGEPLVDGVGACQGQDRHGPTALLRSVAALDAVNNWPAGNTCNIRFSASGLDGEESLTLMEALAATFFQLGGMQLQVNVVDSDTLRAAQASPEQYRDLIVRVAGFSAYFTQLSPAVQEEIISRTAHGA
ncbi:MAG: pyruvate formate lyase family protein, partial [Planctomycetota bacterium]